MAKQKVTLTDNSIKSGVTSDANKAICEYIWNGFDTKKRTPSRMSLLVGRLVKTEERKFTYRSESLPFIGYQN